MTVTTAPISARFISYFLKANVAVQPEPGFPAIGWDGWLGVRFSSTQQRPRADGKHGCCDGGCLAEGRSPRDKAKDNGGDLECGEDQERRHVCLHPHQTREHSYGDRQHDTAETQRESEFPEFCFIWFCHLVSSPNVLSVNIHISCVGC
jgi:hypothetical protein